MNTMAVLIGVITIISIHFIGENMADVVDPPFHMMPLGYHINPTDIEEMTSTNMITPEAFATNYVIPQTPLVLREVTREWLAFTTWTDEYLVGNYSKLELRLGGRKDEKSSMPPQGDVCLGRDSMEHFISTYHGKGDEKYVDSELPTPLYKYVKLPSPLGCGGLSESLIEVDLWMSSGSAQSSLRKHSFNAVTCMLNGSKEVKVVQPKHNHLMYQIIKGDNQRQDNTHYSHVDGTKVDMKNFPLIAKVPEWFSTKLNAGDCLYLPSGSWHIMESEGDKNVAVRFIFQNFKDVDAIKMESCTKESEALPLEEVDPDWKYPGHGRMSMGNSPLSYYLDIMKTSFFSKWDNSLKYDNVHQLLDHLTPYLPFSDQHVRPRTDALYEKLTDLIPKSNRFYTKDMLASLSRDQLREIGNEYIQPHVIENSYDHEYAYFSADTVLAMFENVSLDHNGVVPKEKVIATYLGMGGHLQIITQLWVEVTEEVEIDFKTSRWELDNALNKFYLFCWGEGEAFTDIYDQVEENDEHFDNMDWEMDASYAVPRDEL